MKIVLSVLAALVLLLLCPICLKIEWKKDFSATVGWLFLRFRLWPQKKKKKAAQQPKKPDAQAAPKAAGLPHPTPSQTLTQYADLLPDLLDRLKGCVAFVLRHTKVKRLELNMLVSREDAAETAIAFGRTNQAVYTALGLLQNLLKFDCRPQINIGFDYLGKEEEAEGHATLKVALLFVLAGGIGLLFGLLKATTNREKEKQTAQTV